MDRKINPIALFTSLILLSIASSFFTEREKIIFLVAALIIPFFFGINTLRLLWKLRVILFTVILILAFGFIEKRDTLTVIGEASLFTALVTLYAAFVLNSDLMSLSSTLGKILSLFLSSYGWRISSCIMMSLSIFPIVFECGTEMLEARRSRGGTFFSHPVKNLTSYTVSLITLLFDKVLTFQDALYSRSFSTKEGRTVYPLKAIDWITLILSITLFAGFMLWKKLS